MVFCCEKFARQVNKERKRLWKVGVWLWRGLLRGRRMIDEKGGEGKDKRFQVKEKICAIEVAVPGLYRQRWSGGGDEVG